MSSEYRKNNIVLCLLWPLYGIGQAIIFVPSDLYLSIFFLSFSSPNLSRRRLDVYHTSTHGVALVMVALWNRADHYIFILFLSSSFFYSARQCSHCKRCTSYSNSVCPSVCHVGHWPTFLVIFLLLLFFPRLISAVGDWMSTILPHMVWP